MEWVTSKKKTHRGTILQYWVRVEIPKKARKISIPWQHPQYSILVAKMMVSLDGMVWVSMPSDYARLPAN